MKLLITGGRGFIGSHFVEEALNKGHEVVDIDKMTYAASKELPWDEHENYELIKDDISKLKYLPKCDILINFAAESHVDNSIKETEPFIQSNIMGVHNLLELVRGKRSYDRPLFLQISTDEVYGDNTETSFCEENKLSPSNPYSASKAAAEMLVLSYGRTYGVKYLITRSANNYGARQYEEKLMPRCIYAIKHGEKIPVHGDGSYIRDWTYVKDNVSAIFCIIESKVQNDIFNIAAENHMPNMKVIREVLSWYGKTEEEYVKFVPNRWGQDLKYSISAEKLRGLGWTPKHKDGIYKWI